MHHPETDELPMLARLEERVGELLARLDAAEQDADLLRLQVKKMERDRKRLQTEHQRVCERNEKAKATLERLLNQLPQE